MMVDCGPCKDGRHGDCIKVNECLCYSYGEAHADWDQTPLRVASPFGRVRHLELVTDGGLGSGNWLVGEFPG